MKKTLLASLLFAIPFMSVASPQTSNTIFKPVTIENYDNVSDQLAHCSGVFIAASKVAVEMNQEESVKVLQLAAIVLGLKADTLSPGKDFRDIANNPLETVEHAFDGNVEAQNSLVDDMKKCHVMFNEYTK